MNETKISKKTIVLLVIALLLSLIAIGYLSYNLYLNKQEVINNVDNQKNQNKSITQPKVVSEELQKKLPEIVAQFVETDLNINLVDPNNFDKGIKYSKNDRIVKDVSYMNIIKYLGDDLSSSTEDTNHFYENNKACFEKVTGYTDKNDISSPSIGIYLIKDVDNAFVLYNTDAKKTLNVNESGNCSINSGDNVCICGDYYIFNTSSGGVGYESLIEQYLIHNYTFAYNKDDIMMIDSFKINNPGDENDSSGIATYTFKLNDNNSYSYYSVNVV